MNFSLPFFAAGLLLLAGVATAQSRSASRPAKSDTLPATAPLPTFTGPNRLQLLYDYYHRASPKGKTGSDKPAIGSEQRPDRPYAAAVAGLSEPVERSQPAHLRIGARGGLTYPVFRQSYAGYTPSVGFVVGFVVQMGTGRVSFQSELNYVRYVTRYRNDFSGLTRPAATDRVELPVLAKFTTGPATGTHVFVNAGPYLAFVTSASLNGVKQPVVGSRVTAGVAGGIGTALKTKRGQVILEARGLYQPGAVFSGNPLRAVLTQVTAGYVVPLGGR